MKGYIAVIDQGTSSTRCMIFDRTSQILSSDQKEHRQIYPQPGWVEHDPIEIWQNTTTVMDNAISKAGLDNDQISAIGIANQRETTFLWDRRTGKPVYNAIVWQDTRTAAICDDLAKNGGQNRFQLKTGLPLATYFSGPKVNWILENVPQARHLAEKGDLLFGTADTWLLWNLTGGSNGGLHFTDVTNASRTMLMDLQTLKWDEQILNELQIPRHILPEIRPSAQIYGRAAGKFAGIQIASMLGDQQAALFGQTCFSSGEAKNTYGTGCFMLMNTGQKRIISKNGLLTTPGYLLEGENPVFCLEGSIAIAGALVQWVRDNLHLIKNSAEIEELAESVPDNGDVYFVPAFSGLFAPHWRNDARGVITGLTRFATSGHIARAVLEATAFQTREVLDAMALDSGVTLQALKVDGGMVYNELLMQFQADMLRVPVIRPRIAETTSLGAAYAAGLAVGVWKSLEELKGFWLKDSEWNPQMPQEKAEKLFLKWTKAVERSLKWVDSE